MNVVGSFRPSKCKRHLEITLGKMLQPNASSELDKSMPYIRAANVHWGRVDRSDLKEMWFSPSEMGKYTLRNNDLVVLEGCDVGRCAILEGAPQELGFQNSIHRVRARKGIEIRFVYYWIKHLKSLGYIDLICSKATLAHFTGEKFAETPFPVIDFVSQQAIADFLDRETARIDLLIERKQRLVELVRERSLSAIERAVSAEADLSKLGHHVRILPGYAFTSSEFSHNEEEIRLLRGTNMSPGKIRWDDVVYWPRDAARGLGYVPKC